MFDVKEAVKKKFRDWVENPVPVQIFINHLAAEEGVNEYSNEGRDTIRTAETVLMEELQIEIYAGQHIWTAEEKSDGTEDTIAGYEVRSPVFPFVFAEVHHHDMCVYGESRAEDEESEWDQLISISFRWNELAQLSARLEGVPSVLGRILKKPQKLFGVAVDATLIHEKWIEVVCGPLSQAEIRRLRSLSSALGVTEVDRQGVETSPPYPVFADTGDHYQYVTNGPGSHWEKHTYVLITSQGEVVLDHSYRRETGGGERVDRPASSNRDQIKAMVASGKINPQDILGLKRIERSFGPAGDQPKVATFFLARDEDVRAVTP